MTTNKFGWWLLYYGVALTVILFIPLFFLVKPTTFLEYAPQRDTLSMPITLMMAIGYGILLGPFFPSLARIGKSAFGRAGVAIPFLLLGAYLFVILYCGAQNIEAPLNAAVLGPMKESVLSVWDTSSNATGKHAATRYTAGFQTDDVELKPFVFDMSVDKTIWGMLQSQIGQPVHVRYAVGQLGIPVIFSIVPTQRHFMPPPK